MTILSQANPKVLLEYEIMSMINLIYTANVDNITDYGYADNLLSFFIQDFFLYEALLEIVHYQHIIAICHHNFE